MANEETGKESVLDQVISIDKQDKADTPVSAVAEVIRQRDELKKQIESRIAEDSSVKQDSAKEGDSTQDSEDGGGGDDMSLDEDMDMGKDGEDEKPDSSKDDKDSDEKNDKAKEENQKKEDEQSETDKTNKENDKAKELDKTAAECLTLIRKDASQDYFASVKQSHAAYLLHARRYSSIKEADRISLEEQPIVYTKDKVLQSLKAMVSTVAIYSKTIEQIFSTIGLTLKKYTEQITYYDEYSKTDRVTFTNKLVDDKDILLGLASSSSVDIKYSLRSLYKFNTAVVTLSKTILANPVDSLPGSFQTAGFTQDDTNTDFSYSDVLPGFLSIKANAPVYENYLRTKIEQYNVYALNISKTFDYYNTSPVGLDKIDDLKTTIDYAFKLITSLAVLADNIRALDNALRVTLDTVKVKIFDVENNKIQDLSSLDLDKVIHDVIKLKLVIETSLVTVKLNNTFIVALFRYLKETVALK